MKLHNIFKYIVLAMIMFIAKTSYVMEQREYTAEEIFALAAEDYNFETEESLDAGEDSSSKDDSFDFAAQCEAVEDSRKAIKENNIDELKRIVSAHPTIINEKVSTSEGNRETLLFLAAKQGNAEAIKTLLKHGPTYPSNNIESCDSGMVMSPLAISILLGHAEATKVLMKSKTPPQINRIADFKGNEVELAAFLGNRDVIALFLKHYEVSDVHTLIKRAFQTEAYPELIKKHNLPQRPQSKKEIIHLLRKKGGIIAQAMDSEERMELLQNECSKTDELSKELITQLSDSLKENMSSEHIRSCIEKCLDTKNIETSRFLLANYKRILDTANLSRIIEEKINKICPKQHISHSRLDR